VIKAEVRLMARYTLLMTSRSFLQLHRPKNFSCCDHSILPQLKVMDVSRLSPNGNSLPTQMNWCSDSLTNWSSSWLHQRGISRDCPALQHRSRLNSIRSPAFRTDLLGCPRHLPRRLSAAIRPLWRLSTHSTQTSTATNKDVTNLWRSANKIQTSRRWRSLCTDIYKLRLQGECATPNNSWTHGIMILAHGIGWTSSSTPSPVSLSRYRLRWPCTVQKKKENTRLHNKRELDEEGFLTLFIQEAQLHPS
jgi:hypothetical protein